MVEKAEIIVLDENRRPKERIPVMYNPAEYSYTRLAQYSKIRHGQLHFNGVTYQPFTLSLFFDTYEAENRDVRKLTDRLAALLKPVIAGKDTKKPAECIFSWGRFTLAGVVQTLEQKFTLFLTDGTPVRATVDLTLQPTATAQEIKELLGKEACRKLWTVKSGDRLELIAYQTLGDTELWRLIARENRIANPLRFPETTDIGKTLVIPEA